MWPSAQWFRDRPAGAVTLVETPVSRAYVQKARIAFFVVTCLAGLLTGATLSLAMRPFSAVLLGLLVGLFCGLLAALLIRVWPVLRVLWWWAAEVAVTATVVCGSAVLARVSHPLLAVAVLLVSFGVLVGVRPVRRRVVAWSWCVVVRHRLRLCFAEFIRSASRLQVGRLPLVLWARPTPAGERVWLWLRPGLDLTDLDGKAGKLAVTCWAGEARIVRASARFAALVRVDITRRDPLTGLVASPLAAWLSDLRAVDAPVSPGLPPLGLDLLDIPEPAPEQRASRR